jgi:hypothetical protein
MAGEKSTDSVLATRCQMVSDGKTRLAIFFETLPEPRTGTPQWERQPVLVALAEAFPST